MKNRYIINIILMIVAIVLIHIFFMEELGNWRFFGLLGFFLVGYFWDIESGISEEEI